MYKQEAHQKALFLLLSSNVTEQFKTLKRKLLLNPRKTNKKAMTTNQPKLNMMPDIYVFIFAVAAALALAHQNL